MSYNFDKNLSTPADTMEIDTEACYGYWQNNSTGTEGGLWFEVNSEGKLALTDYDGVFELPSRIVKALREAGLIVDADFE